MPSGGQKAATGPRLLRQISKDHSHKSIVELFKEKEAGTVEEPKEEEAKKEAKEEAPSKEEPRARQDIAPPRLVRGKTGLMKKRNHVHDAIAELAATALPTWMGIDPEEIEVSEVSGGGGSKTFKVIAPDGTEPQKVALHSRSECVTSEDISEQRLEAASAALLASGAAPRRLAQGGDWYIVKWAGKALGSAFGSCDAKPDELGKLMAKIHSVSAHSSSSPSSSTHAAPHGTHPRAAFRAAGAHRLVRAVPCQDERADARPRPHRGRLPRVVVFGSHERVAEGRRRRRDGRVRCDDAGAHLDARKARCHMPWRLPRGQSRPRRGKHHPSRTAIVQPSHFTSRPQPLSDRLADPVLPSPARRTRAASGQSTSSLPPCTTQRTTSRTP